MTTTQSTKRHISAAAKRANLQVSQAKATTWLPTTSALHQNTPQGRSDGGHSSDKKNEEAIIFDVTPVRKEGNTSFGKSMPMNSPQVDSTPIEKKQSSSFGKGSIPMVVGSPIFDTTPNPSKSDSTFGISLDSPLTTPPTSAPVAIQATTVIEKVSPTHVQESSPSCQITPESREINNAGAVRRSMYCKSTIPTRQTCPPPLPLYQKQLGMSQDDIFSSIVKSNTPSLKLGQLQHSRSAKAQKGQTSIGLKRSSSGGDSTHGQGYYDASSFSFGPEFDRPDSLPLT
jgi:hypothetical protein